MITSKGYPLAAALPIGCFRIITSSFETPLRGSSG